MDDPPRNKSPPQALIIVTSLYALPGKESYFSELVKRVNIFLTAACRAGVPVVLFTDKELTGLPLNVTRVHLALSETAAWRAAESHRFTMPRIHDPNKDTAEYMVLMCAKMEFLSRAAALTQHPCAAALLWCDCGISKLVNDDAEVFCDALARMSSVIVNRLGVGHLPEYWLTFPSIWPAAYVDADAVSDYVRWQMCGGILLCNPETAHVLCDHFNQGMVRMLEWNGALVWETNVMAAIEHSLQLDVEVTRWDAIHDLSMFEVWRSPWVMMTTIPANH